jgi:hypothetical protein
MTKRPIAALIAALVVGVPAGIAAITEPSADAGPQQPAPVEVRPMQSDAQGSGDAATPAQPEVMAEAASPAVSNTVEKYVAVPYTNIRLKVSSNALPSSAAELPDMLPSTMAYFDRLNANRTLTGAAGSAFPMAAAELPQQLPATVAYFDRMESSRLAAATPAPAPVTAIAPAPAATESPAATASSSAEINAAMYRPATQPATERPGT